MKIIHVSNYDITGGAARAAYRIHRSLVEYSKTKDIDSEMWVGSKVSDDDSVSNFQDNMPINILKKIKIRYQNIRYKFFYTENMVFHSMSNINTGLGKMLNRSNADIIHLHWIGDKTISIKEIGSLNKPVVWTLHDQWPFCGAEHYTILPPQIDNRFIEGYHKNNRPSFERGLKINEKTWNTKVKYWKKQMNFVATSNWMMDCADKSLLLKKHSKSFIPYPIDLNSWRPIEKEVSRSILGINPDKKILLFGAIGGIEDKRKGAKYLIEALKILSQKKSWGKQNLQLIVFGKSKFKNSNFTSKLNFPITYLGHLHDDIALRLAYSAANVMIVPSLLEAFGQTASEAHACGTPVVAFDTGGLSDIVDHKVTGALAEPLNPESLAFWIEWVIEDADRNKALGENARSKALTEWSQEKIAAKYYQLYDLILGKG